MVLVETKFLVDIPKALAQVWHHRFVYAPTWHAQGVERIKVSHRGVPVSLKLHHELVMLSTLLRGKGAKAASTGEVICFSESGLASVSRNIGYEVFHRNFLPLCNAPHRMDGVSPVHIIPAGVGVALTFMIDARGTVEDAEAHITLEPVLHTNNTNRPIGMRRVAPDWDNDIERDAVEYHEPNVIQERDVRERIAKGEKLTPLLRTKSLNTSDE